MKYIGRLLLNKRPFYVYADENHKKHFLEIKDNEFCCPTLADYTYLDHIFNHQSAKSLNINLKDLATKCGVSLLVLSMLLTMTSCKKSKDTEPLEMSQIEINSLLEKTLKDNGDKIAFQDDGSILYTEDEDYKFLYEYKEYKKYLKDKNPTYELLYSTLTEKRESEIPSEYKSIIKEFIENCEKNNIDTKKMAVFYENLTKLVIEFGGEAQTNEFGEYPAAVFVPGEEKSVLTIYKSDNPESSTKPIIEHELYHSCKSTLIKVKGKNICITDSARAVSYEDGVITPYNYGISASEGLAELINNLMIRGRDIFSYLSDGYIVVSDFIEFWASTANLSLNEVFSYTVLDFQKSLDELGLASESGYIIDTLDFSTIRTQDIAIDYQDIRENIYKTYISALVKYYISEGYSSNEIYFRIETAFNNSTIQLAGNSDKNSNTYRYDNYYLYSQQELAELINETVATILSKNHMPTINLSMDTRAGIKRTTSENTYDFDIEIPFDVKKTTIMQVGCELDYTTVKNSNLFLREEDGTYKLSSYIDMPDGTIACYDCTQDGQIIKYNASGTGKINGAKLKDLLELGLISVIGNTIIINCNWSDIPNDIMPKYCKDEITLEDMKSQLFMYIDYNDENFRPKFCNFTITETGEYIFYGTYNGNINSISLDGRQGDRLDNLTNNGIVVIYDDEYSINDSNWQKYFSEQEKGSFTLEKIS